VQSDPPIDATGNGNNPNVVSKWHFQQTFGAKLVGICARACTAAAVECVDGGPIMNKREEISTETTEVRSCYRNCGIRRDRCVNCVAACRKDGVSGACGKLVCGSNEVAVASS